MTENVSRKLSSLNIGLDKIITSRSKEPSKRKILHSRVQVFLGMSREIASTVNFAITIVFNSDSSVEESWEMLESRLDFLKGFFNQFPLYSALIGIEIHRAAHHKKVSKSENASVSGRNSGTQAPGEFGVPGFAKNSLAGRSHFHIHLTLYNDFLCPSAVEIQNLFFQNPLTMDEDISIKYLPPDNPRRERFDCKNWFLYCTKDLSDLTTQKFFSEKTNFKSSCMLFSGHPNSDKDCLNVSLLFKHYNLNLTFVGAIGGSPGLRDPGASKEKGNLLPFVRYSKSEIGQISELLAGIISTLNLALWPDKDYLAVRVPGLKASWSRDVKLSDFDSYLIREVPVQTRDLLLESRCFKLFTQDYKKLDLHWFPELKINLDLIEFKDGLYSFKRGNFVENPCDFYETPFNFFTDVEFYSKNKG